MIAKTLSTALWDYKREKRTAYRARWNNASKLGHPCVRHLVLARTTPVENIPLFDVHVQFRFDDGNVLEGAVRDDLKASGFPITQDQRPFEWPEYEISGKIDGMVMIDGKNYPVEIKKVSPWFENTIKKCIDADGIISTVAVRQSMDRFLWMYLCQLNLYCLMSNSERGVFAFKNPVTGIITFAELPLDYELGEQTLQKAEAVIEHMKEGTLPEHCADPRICGMCQFAHVCKPPVLDTKGEDMEIILDDELEFLLDEWNELKPNRDLWERIDKNVAARIRGRTGICGKYRIGGKWTITPEKVIPEHVQAERKSWRKEIENLVLSQDSEEKTESQSY